MNDLNFYETMAKDGQIPNSLQLDSDSFWHQEGPGPFGSLIELAFKLKNVHFRLLQKFGDKPESCAGSNCIIFESSAGVFPKYKDRQRGKSSQENVFAKSSKTLQDSSDNFAVISSRNTSSDFKLPLLPESNKLRKSSGVHYANYREKNVLPVQRGTKSFHTAAGAMDLLRYSGENPATRKSRRLQRCHKDLKRKHNCPLCLYQTDNRCHLQRHQSSVHDADKAYYCYVCKKEFSRSERVKAHFLNMHPETAYHSKMARKDAYISEDDNDFYMETDEFDSFSGTSTQLVVSEAVNSASYTNDSPVTTVPLKSWERYCHIASQPLINQQIFCCQVCSFTGSDIWLMKRHYLEVHLGATTYLCRICRYSSSCTTRLVSHMLGHGELICFHCSYSTTEVKPFEKHLIDCSLLVHCPTCGMSFVDREQLQAHAIEVHKSALFCCDRCSFSSSSYAELSLHEGMHIVSNSSLVQEIESDDEMLLGPYRSRPEVANLNLSSRLLKQHLKSNTGAICDDAVINNDNRDDVSDNVLNSSIDASVSMDNSIATSTIPSSIHSIYECLVPNCGFKACWKKSLELHTENYHSVSLDHFKDDRSMTACGWPLTVDCPASGFFPCPFCPNYRTFKYRKSFEKHLGQHGLNHKKYPYLLAGLNLKGEALNNSLMGSQ